ncbi:MAG: CPBP family intramembrane metalloprotease [Sphaerobacter sp.]|nr:CPBP family intramembrane metalloprotease [Sphaerobacter sp.]
MRATPPLRCLLLVFALAAPFWLLGALVTTPERVPIGLPLSALQLVCPLIAAALLVYRADGSAGLRRLLTRAVRYRGIAPIRWLPIFRLMPAIYLLADGIQRLLGRSLLDLRFPLPTILALFLVLRIAALAEEVGWMGYATDPLQARWGAPGAAIIPGLVWAAFLQGTHRLEWIVWHRSGGVALRVLIAWVYNNTGRSVLAAALLHTTDNVKWQLTEMSGAPYDPAINAAIMAVVAGTVTLLWGPATLGRFRSPRPVTLSP